MSPKGKSSFSTTSRDTTRCCTVTGKGNKQRRLYFGARTAKALWAYLNEEARDPEGALFLADNGPYDGEPLTRHGLLQLVRRLGRKAGIETARCSPHTFRHTFAIEFLRAGGNVFTLKELLGHTTLAMVNRYVALAQADLEAQHRRFSPGDRLRRLPAGRHGR
jgi:site-specific recombinase XerD